MKVTAYGHGLKKGIKKVNDKFVCEDCNLKAKVYGEFAKQDCSYPTGQINKGVE